MPEHTAGSAAWAAVQTGPQAPMAQPAQTAPAASPQARQSGNPALPLGWQSRVEAAAESQVQKAAAPAAPARAVATGGAAALARPDPQPDRAPQGGSPNPPRLGAVAPPLRIMAALIGVALGAVPFTMTIGKSTSVPAPQPGVAHFQVKDQDMPHFWRSTR